MAKLIRFDTEQTALLEEIADALLPLDEWVRTKSYKPPGTPPWRQDGGALSAKRLGVVRFLEGLLAESSGDADLIAHFERTAHEPLARCPIPEAGEWRARRGLEPQTKFDIVASENLFTAGKDQPLDRVSFYSVHLPLLAQAARDAKAAGYDPKAFVEDLLQDRSGFWPGGSQKSSVFIKRLLTDVLYALMGQRSPLPEPWRSALLTELGELRRVGNHFDPYDAMAAVKAFRDLLERVAHAPEPEALGSSWGVPGGPAPVGSPPLTTKREHLEPL